jgi:lipase chaperone LimK
MSKIILNENKKTFSKSSKMFFNAQKKQMELDLEREKCEEERKKTIKDSLTKIKELKKNNRQMSKEILVTLIKLIFFRLKEKIFFSKRK